MTTLAINDNQILKNVTAGKYRDYYLVYGRKSTDEPNNQKNSIKYQRGENIRFAQKEKFLVAPITLPGFCLDGVISERHSGFKEDNEISITNGGMVQYSIDRPKFHRLVQFLSKGLFKGVIVLCWDRISRNRGDDTVVRKLMKNGIDIRFVYAHYDKTSAGALHMDIDGMFAEHHSRVTSEKVRNITRDLRGRGICTYKAPIGYLNQGTMERKPFDTLRAPIIKQIFELAAQNRSVSDLAMWANAQGLTTLPIRRRRTPEEMLAEEEEDVEKGIARISRPVTRAMIHRILTSEFYTGKITDGDGNWVPSKSHEALIREELFAKVRQALAGKRQTVSYVDKVDLPHRRSARCGDCGRVYTPYMQKGIQYFYSRCRAGCPNLRKSFNLGFFESAVGKHMAQLAFTEEELAEIDVRDKRDISALEDERRKRMGQYDRRKRKTNEDLAYLRENKLSLLKSGVYAPEGFLAEEQKLMAEFSEIESQMEASGASIRQILKDTIKLSELLKNGSKYYSFAKSKEKEQLIRIIFSELSVSGNTLNYQCKNGFKVFESRFDTVCGQTAWLSELLGQRANICMASDALSALISLN